MRQHFGKHGRDVVTGFKGLITGHCEYWTGCNQTLLIPLATEEVPRPEGEWFDDNRIYIIEDLVQVRLIEHEVVATGGPRHERMPSAQ